MRWLWAAVHGDFGIPFESPTETVTGLIARAWPVTLRVGGLTLVLAYSVGLFLGILAAVKQNTWIDSVATFLATMGIGLPNFVFGFLLIEVFAVTLHWFPTGGCCQPNQLLLPVIAYALAPHGEHRALHPGEHPGGDARRVRDHGPRPRLARVAGAAALRFAHRLDSPDHDSRTEYPGHPDRLDSSSNRSSRSRDWRNYFTTASQERDYPTIMALALLTCVLWGTLYLLSDVAYTIVDPRVRLEGLSR